MYVTTVTAPAVEPVTLAEAKSHLRLEESSDDVYVQTLIQAARQHIEKVCWRGLLQQSLQMTRGSFRGDDKFEQLPDYATVSQQFPYACSSEFSRFMPYLELPGGHLAETPAVVVTYLDANGTLQTLAPSAYLTQSAEGQTGKLWLNQSAGYSWPDTMARFDAVKVNYTIGWLNPSKLPQPLKQAVLLLVSQMYEYRTPEVTGTIATTLEFTIDALTSPYRFVRL